MNANVFDHEKMVVYQRAKEFLAVAYALIRALPRGNADVADQLGRAARGVMFNIAEGAGRRTAKEKAKFYDYARGSSTECASALDAIAIGGLGDAVAVATGRDLLLQIVRMLAVLARRLKERDE